MKHTLIPSLLLSFALSACAPVAPDAPPAPPATPTPNDTCNAAGYASLIGKDAPNALIVPEPKRMYRIGDPVTLDFNPARVNVQLDQTDVIAAITCG